MNTSTGKATILIGIIGIVIFTLLMFLNQAFASWGEAVLGISLFMAVIFLIDKYVLTEIDIMQELKSGNMAVAIFIGHLAIAFAIIFFACIAGGEVIKLLG